MRRLALAVLLLPLAAPAEEVVDFAADPAASPRAFTRVIGPYEFSGLGSSTSEAIPSRAMAYGDFDGDGIDDLALGAPLGEGPIALNDGTAYILFGGPAVARTEIALSWQSPGAGTSVVLPEGGEDHTAQALSAGDYDGDGYDDLAIGSPLASPQNRFFGGRLTILFGGPAMRGATFDLSQPYGTYGEARVLARNGSQIFGIELTSGDFNADGRDDVAIASQHLAGTERGIYVLHGDAALRSTTLDLANASDRARLSLLLPGASSFGAGARMASGDADGDGVDDFAMNYSSAAYVVHGGPAFPTGSASLDAPPAVLRITKLNGTFFGDRAFVHLADDPSREPGTDEFHFATVSLTGSTSAQRGTIGRVDLSGRAGTTLALDGADSGRVARLINNAYEADFGMPVAIADLDGDGAHDLLTRREAFSRGEALAFPLSALPASGTTGIASATLDTRALPPDSTRLNRFAQAIIADGDWNGDGAPDAAFAAPLHSYPFGAMATWGVVGVLFGETSATEFTATRRVPAGTALWRGFDGRRSPRIRAWVRALDAEATATATIHREAPASLPGAAPVWWEIDASATTGGELRLRATAEELAGLGAPLLVYRADSPAGPWTALPTTRDGAFLFIAETPALGGAYAIGTDASAVSRWEIY